MPPPWNTITGHKRNSTLFSDGNLDITVNTASDGNADNILATIINIIDELVGELRDVERAGVRVSFAVYRSRICGEKQRIIEKMT